MNYQKHQEEQVDMEAQENNITLEEYLQDTKRHINPDDELGFEQILQHKDYFQDCLNRGLSTYNALLFFGDYLDNTGIWYVKTKDGYEFIFERVNGENKTNCSYSICQGSDIFMGYGFVCNDEDIQELRRATEEEKEFLNDAIGNWIEGI